MGGGWNWAGKLPEVIKSNLVPGNNYDPSVPCSSQPQKTQGPPSTCTCGQGSRECWVNLAKETMVVEVMKEAGTRSMWVAVFLTTQKGVKHKRKVGCVQLASLSMGHSGSSLFRYTAMFPGVCLTELLLGIAGAG